MGGFSSITGQDTIMNADNASFNGTERGGVLATNGQLWVGSTAVNAGGTHINVGSITSPLATLTIGYSSPNITIDVTGGGLAVEHLTGDTGGQLNPTANNFNLLSSVVAAGTTPVVIAGSGSTLTTKLQKSQAIAAADATKIGLSNFDSARFTVDANGFVSASTTGLLQTLTGNSGTATPVANNINVITANSTVKFVGSGATLTQDFAMSNLGIGSSFPSLAAGTFNLGLGFQALNAIASTGDNVAVGYQAGLNLIGNSNTLIGKVSGTNLTAADYNTFLGSQTGTSYTGTETSNILIGAQNTGTLGESNTTRIGKQGTGAGAQNRCFISGIVGVTNSNAQTVTINSSTGQLGVTNGSIVAWSVITADQTAVVNNGYIANKGSALLLTLPTTAAIGDIIRVTGINTALGIKITQNANQQIFFGTSSTTLGATGFLQSTAIRDSIELVCVVAGASTVYNAISSVGNWTVS